MKILTRYVLSEFLKVFAVTLAAMTLFMVLLGVMKEAYQQGLGLKQILLLLPFALPEALRFSVPGTVLFAACSVYGRLSAFNEVTALKAAGISPWALCWPGFAFAALLSFATVYLNDLAVSWGRDGIRRVVIGSVEEIAYSKLSQQKSFASKNFSVHVKRVDGRRLIEPTFSFQANLDSPAYSISAAEAELRANPDTDTLTILFKDAEYEFGQIKGRWPGTYPREIPLSETTRKSGSSGSPSDLPMHQLRPEIDRATANIALWRSEMAAQAALSMLSGNIDALADPLWAPLRHREHETEMRIIRLHLEPHRRWANGFSCLCFVMVGAPLAIWWRNGDFLAVFFVCFAPVILVYYPLLMFTVDRAKAGDVPALALWIGDALFGFVGLWIMRRVVRY